MMGRGGRDRFQGDFTPKLEEKGKHSGWGVAPPSRHLWVGNLSPRITQNTLYEQFLRFGDLENIAHLPGRSYAFVNFRKEEDAVIALRGLQGAVIEGMPLRIEFAKGDRPPSLPQEEDYPLHSDGRHSIERGDSHLRRDLGPPRLSPQRSYDKSGGDNSAEPSEVLWIGFPSYLKVDEMALRRAFSPFGEIDNITTFPGRSYAFIRYRSVVAACRAKEALQGKLFNNPRVSICFAKSDSSPAEHGRSSTSGLFPPHLKSSFHLGGRDVETFQRDRSFESPIGEFHKPYPHFVSNWERVPGDVNDMNYGRDIPLRTGPGPGPSVGGTFEIGSQRRVSGDVYERHRDSPAVERDAPWLDLPFERHRKTPPFEDSWGMDDGSFPFSKKLKTDSFPDGELPEYPFADMKQEKIDARPKLFPSMHEHHSFNRSVEPLPFDYKGLSDHSRNITRTYAESDDHWRNSDRFSAGPFLSNLSSINLQRFNSESHQPMLNEEWKWEGTIAKGGTPVCRARCFPVGKVLDFMLPEFLDCTARTGLDMLAKHYYQAASTWVVFFVPESDSDITFYNEFMHYLGEKQRAAVAKLGEKTTLFLVPPSEFSEQVLKVPGKVSISGVILKFQQTSSSLSSLHHPLETMGSKVPSLTHRPTDTVKFHEDTPFRKPTSPSFITSSQGQNYFSSSSGHLTPITSTFPPLSKPGDNLLNSGPVHSVEDESDIHVGGRHETFHHQSPLQSSWSSHLHNPNSSIGIFPSPSSNAPLHALGSSVVNSNPSANSRVVQGAASSNYTPENPNIVPVPSSKFPPQQGSKPQPPSSLPIPLQPEQLAQLAAVLGQQKQLGKEPVLPKGESSKQSGLVQNPSVQAHASVPSVSVVSQPAPSSLPSSLMGPHLAQASRPSGLVGSQPSQTQLLQHHPDMSTVQGKQQSNQQALSTTPGDAEADPQKRLQATLQLAAALLQQIQQQAKTTNQK